MKKYYLYVLILLAVSILLYVSISNKFIELYWCDEQANTTNCATGFRYAINETSGSYALEQKKETYGCYKPFECWCVNSGQCYKGIKLKEKRTGVFMPGFYR